jgi:hypothetical protein
LVYSFVRDPFWWVTAERARGMHSIFADKGPAVFVASNSGDELLELVAITNSRAFALLVSLQLARTELAQSYEVGLIQNTPVPKPNSADRQALAELGGSAWKLKRSLDTSTETSHSFVLPGLSSHHRQ